MSDPLQQEPKKRKACTFKFYGTGTVFQPRGVIAFKLAPKESKTFQVEARVHCTGQAKVDISVNFIASKKSQGGTLEIVADVLRDGQTIFAGGQTLVRQPAPANKSNSLEQTVSTFLEDTSVERGTHSYALVLNNAGTAPIDVQYVVFIVTS